MLKKYDITADLLPKIKVSDPEAAALGAKVGDIIEVTRKDMTGTYKVYRLVVN